MSEAQTQPLQDRGSNRSQRPQSAAFREFISGNWQERSSQVPGRDIVADYTPTRREGVSQAFPGDRLIIPAGTLKVRSNDTDYRFRPHSAFAHLTGLGTDEEPDAVLVLHPRYDSDGEPVSHDPVLYFRPLAPRDSEEFWADARYGEFWVGSRPTFDDLESRTGIPCAHIDELADAIAKDAGQVHLRVVPKADQTVSELVEEVRAQNQVEADEALDATLAEALSELRLIKDDWEVGEMRKAIAATISGFDEIVKALPRAAGHPRGEVGS